MGGVLMEEKQFFVYIITNKHHTVLYTGITNNFRRRLYEHRNGLAPGFAAKYRCKKLVYWEVGGSAEFAIAREKQIKAGSRQKKLDLIDAKNPGWLDLSDGWE